MKTVERNAHNMYYARVYLLEKDPSSKVEIESPVGTADFSFSSVHPETSPPLFAQPSLLPLHSGIPQYSSIGNGRNSSDRKSGGRVPPGLLHIDQGMMVCKSHQPILFCFAVHIVYYVLRTCLLVQAQALL